MCLGLNFASATKLLKLALFAGLINFSLTLVRAPGALLLPAQQSGCASQTIFAGVENEKDEAIAGLTAADFHAMLEKQIVQVSSAEPYPLHRIIIVFDTSGSMRVPFVARESSLTTVDLVRQSTPEILFAFATFSGRFEMKEEFTANHDEFAQKIVRDLQSMPKVTRSLADPSGLDSGIYDAIIAGIDALEPRKAGDALIVITDGMDNASRSSQAATVSKVLSSGVRLFAIILNSQFSRQVSSEDSSEARFEKMVNGAGGEVFRLGTDYPARQIHPKHIEIGIREDLHNIPDASNSILRYMNTTYRLQIALPAALPKPTEWKLEVAANSTAKNRSILVRYQPQLFPCSVTSEH